MLKVGTQGQEKLIAGINRMVAPIGFPFFVTTLKPTLVRKKIVKVGVLYFDRLFEELLR